MRTLYHWPLDPQSRQARLSLEEKRLRFKMVQVNPWEIDETFMALSPEGRPPVLVENVPGGQVVISGARAICEYAEDSAGRVALLPGSAAERAEARRICSWFDIKFADEVNAFILAERLEKTLTGGGAPDPQTLREGRKNLTFHLDYLDFLLQKRSWLAGHDLSLADLAAGAHLSCLDFIGEISWKDYRLIKEWYQKLKSRPSFRPILGDSMPGLIPPRHYSDLDF